MVSAVVLVAAGAAWGGGGTAALGAAATDGTTTLVSVSSDETQSNDASFDGPAMTPDGRFVVFTSSGSNLVDGDTNNSTEPDPEANDGSDVFLRDRTAGTTSRVSVSSNEIEGNNRSGGGVISADGRFVAFWSVASNLVPGDTNKRVDVFVRDRANGTTRRVSVSSNQTQANADTLEESMPSISADGRYVAFESYASNLVRGDTNKWIDVFVRDRTNGTTRRVSVSSNQTQGNGNSLHPVLSADGKRVVFVSGASKLVPGDTNRSRDLFLRYRPTGTTTRVSVNSNEAQGNGATDSFSAITPDGRYVAMDSAASNLVSGDTNMAEDVFVRDRIAGTTQRVSVHTNGAQGDDLSRSPSISADGQRVAFWSAADNLVDGDTGEKDVFVRDRVAGTTSLVSVSIGGTPRNGQSFGSAISADGNQVAFTSDSSNLVPGDTNGQQDTFVRDFVP